MPLIIKEGQESTIEIIPAGEYPARCYGVYDLGTQETNWGTKHQIMIMFEIPELRLDDDRVRVIKKVYTMSLFEKSTLRIDLKKWRGKDLTPEELDGFDIYAVVGKACILEIEHGDYQGKPYARIDRVRKMTKGVKVAKLENPEVRYSISEDGANLHKDTPEWIVKKIMESAELSGGGGQFDAGKTGTRSVATKSGGVAKAWCLEVMEHHADIVDEAMGAVGYTMSNTADAVWIDIRCMVEAKVK